MASTLLLDRTTWDLVLDAAGNIAVADEPYALAQDAASAIQTWGPNAKTGAPGECYFDTTFGLDWNAILAQAPQFALFKQKAVDQAKTVPGVVAAVCFVTSFSSRGISGQVQVTDANGVTSAASFAVINPQGVG